MLNLKKLMRRTKNHWNKLKTSIDINKLIMIRKRLFLMIYDKRFTKILSTLIMLISYYAIRDNVYAELLPEPEPISKEETKEIIIVTAIVIFVFAIYGGFLGWMMYEVELAEKAANAARALAGELPQNTE